MFRVPLSRSTAASNSLRIAVRISALGWRRSMLILTLSGTVLRNPG
jgi:hypothetical protein